MTADDASEATERCGDRRAVITGVAVAVVLALGAGSSFGLLSGGGEAGGPVEAEPTERAVASLPAPESEPRPVVDHFPSIDGLNAVEVDDTLIAGLEERLAPLDGEYAATRHRELRDGDERVAIISLLRADAGEEAAGLRRNALSGLGELFETVRDDELANEQILRADSVSGSALLWLPDTDSVLVVSALDEDRAEVVLSEVVASVRAGDGRKSDDD